MVADTPEENVGAEPAEVDGEEGERGGDAAPSGAPSAPWPGRRAARTQLSADERDRMLSEARDVRFPVVMRGYARTDVDRYVTEVNRLIAELEVSSSPAAAVRHALDEVSEQTRDILQRAHESAEEIAASARAKADERLQQAEQETLTLQQAAERETGQLREAAADEVAALRDAATRKAEETLDAAESRARELTHSAELIWRERNRLIEDITALATQLLAIGEAEGKRFPRPGVDEQPSEPA